MHIKQIQRSWLFCSGRDQALKRNKLVTVIPGARGISPEQQPNRRWRGSEVSSPVRFLTTSEFRLHLRAIIIPSSTKYLQLCKNLRAVGPPKEGNIRNV